MSYREIRKRQLARLRDPSPERRHGLTDDQVFQVLDALGCVDRLVDEFGAERVICASDFAGIISHIEELHVSAVAYDRLRSHEDPGHVHDAADAQRAELGLPPWRLVVG